MNDTLTVQPGSKIRFDFIIMLADTKEIVDQTKPGKPAVCCIGDGNLLPGFEKNMLGMKEGEKSVITIPPESGFGQNNPNNVQQFKRTDFASDLDLQEGLIISFADANKNELPGVVKTVDGEQITVDFNHPLAGKTLLFEVNILNIEPMAS